MSVSELGGPSADCLAVIIRSVLDVKDETPLPKGSTAQTLFGRSILILTPARALKFTATSEERHQTWLTALAFLSQSSDGPTESFQRSLAPQPQAPQETEVPAPQANGGSRRNTIRDSIRIAKGKSRPDLSGVVPQPIHGGGGPMPDGAQDVSAAMGPLDAMTLAADPPIVPRFLVHGRRRSNTGPHKPPTSFRSFTHQAMPSSNYSFVTNGSSELNGNGSSHGGLGFHSGQSSFSRGTSDVSAPSIPMAPPQNFFDAVGTVRMEAFVRRPPSIDPEEGRRGEQRKKRVKGGTWAGRGSTEQNGERVGQHDHFVQTEDPFRGF